MPDPERCLRPNDGRRTLMVASIRYLDQFVKLDGTWYFAERKLLADWTATRPLQV